MEQTLLEVCIVPTDFPFVEIPKELEEFIGKRDPGTRMYRRDGSQEESAVWFDVLTELIGPSVSPGGVGMYCPVSRAAVYKRIQEGKLSIFLFHVTHRKTTLFGKNKILRDRPYGYIPASEARAWREELEQRALSRGTITEEDLEGAKPDWHGEFLEWRNQHERMGLLDVLKADGITPTEFALGFAKARLIRKDEFKKLPVPPPRTRAEEAAWLRKARAEERKRREEFSKVMARLGERRKTEGNAK
ncbi:MAG TPA: hypothetical protein VHY22_03890 [Chthoniobacteraceae bacterium]|jgi:hypothetical protein|nr:hypothetical protein [Chthoniobacteraceae bacterium]